MKKFLFFLLLICFTFGVNAEGEALLKNIKVNGKECKCIDYDCEIEIDANSATITYELVNSEATVDKQSGFIRDLTSQVTTIKVIVSNTLNGEKVENTYNIIINKHERSIDNTLSKLKVNDKEIELKEEVNVYNYEAKYDEDKIVVTATCNDVNAKIDSELEFEFPLDRSSLSIDIPVKAESGDVNTYRVFLTRGERPNTYLKSLKFDKANIDFKKDVTEYETNVEYSVNSLLVEAVAESDDATVKVEKEDLVVGENTIKVIVTNLKAETIYTIKVTREPNMDKSLANLKSLTIKEYKKIDFDPNVLDYTLKFNDIPTSLDISAIPENEEAKVSIENNKDLEEDSRIIIKVTLENPTIEREYTLKIEKEESFTDNKMFIVISIIVLLITMIVLFILDVKEKRIKRLKKLNIVKNLLKKKEEAKKKSKKEEKKKEEEEEIEII